ncbi:YfiR family protein [bacterium]|nr:YfiR family protein [bacterium]
MNCLRKGMGNLMTVCFLCLVTFSVLGVSSAEVLESEAKAEFIFRIVQFIDWEEEQKSGEFSIGVIGDADFATVLRRVLVGRKVKGRKITVKFAKNAKELSAAEVVFASGSNRRRLGGVIAGISESSTLTLGDSDAFLKAGGMISMVVSRSGKIRLGAGRKALGKSNLKVSSKLMRILAR